MPATPHRLDNTDPARAANDALRRHIAFLEAVASDPDAPRPERLRALELLAQIAGRADPGERTASKAAAKHASKHTAKHAAKHVAKHASKHASKHAAKTASKHAAGDRQLASGSGPRRLADPGVARRLSPGPDGLRALPSGG